VGQALLRCLVLAQLVNIVKAEAVQTNPVQKIFIVNVPSKPVMQLVAGLIIVMDRELVAIKHQTMVVAHQLVMVASEHQAKLAYIILVGENILVVLHCVRGVRQERVRILQVAVKIPTDLLLAQQLITGAMALVHVLRQQLVCASYRFLVNIAVMLSVGQVMDTLDVFDHMSTQTIAREAWALIAMMSIRAVYVLAMSIKNRTNFI
jgi:hypothetical protein